MHRRVACAICGEPCEKRKRGKSGFAHCAACIKANPVTLHPGATARDKRLLANYGISQKDYERVLKAQGGTCAICPTKPKTNRSLDVDHSHTAGTLRGLLCPRCNQRLLPAALDDPDILEAAAAYLRRPPLGFVPDEDEIPASLRSYRRRADDGKPNTMWRNAPAWMKPAGIEREM